MPKRTPFIFDRRHPAGPTVKSWERGPAVFQGQRVRPRVVQQCGWGRLIFAHTFETPGDVAETLLQEKPGQRDIAFYLRDAHVVLALHPQELFLDPSHTFRLWLSDYRPGKKTRYAFVIEPVRTRVDVGALNRIYAVRNMVTVDPDFLMRHRRSRKLMYFVAKDAGTKEIFGVVMAVDHRAVFQDPERGASLWSLAVDPQCPYPGVGEGLIRHVAERLKARRCHYVDLSVLHDNHEAIALYKKLGFERIPVFSVKMRNPINERLFTGPTPAKELNVYATIIVDEARRRGIAVEVLDAEYGYFRLTFGGRSVTCRESLSEMTTAIAMSRCTDKTLTRRVLEAAGLSVPAQQLVDGKARNREFLSRYGSVVVKPVSGEQGMGISVDVRTPKEMDAAIETAKRVDQRVLLEQYVEGQDLRIVVINYEVVAAAVRRPARVTGTGKNSIAELIERQSQRRMRATGGESHVPLDAETERCIRAIGYKLTDVLPVGKTVSVRKTANLHTGGTIHDVTSRLHPDLGAAAIAAAKALEIPVVGLDLIVASVSKPDYVIIEANERPGLANHEPQPTGERFIDLLFPQTVTKAP